MEEKKATWGIALRVWWSMFWRAVLIYFIMGFLIGVFGSVAGWDNAKISLYTNLLVLVSSIPLGIYLLKIVLGKKYKTFRVAIIRVGIND